MARLVRCEHTRQQQKHNAIWLAFGALLFVGLVIAWSPAKAWADAKHRQEIAQQAAVEIGQVANGLDPKPTSITLPQTPGASDCPISEVPEWDERFDCRLRFTIDNTNGFRLIASLGDARFVWDSTQVKTFLN